MVIYSTDMLAKIYYLFIIQSQKKLNSYFSNIILKIASNLLEI